RCGRGVRAGGASWEFLASSDGVWGWGPPGGLGPASLPPLPAERLSVAASQTLANWKRMPVEQRQGYWGRFEAVRDTLRERLAREGPPGPHKAEPPSPGPFRPQDQERVHSGNHPWRAGEKNTAEVHAPH